MTTFKRVFDPKNPLPWYTYIFMILGLFLGVLILAGTICLILYSAKDAINHFFGIDEVSQLYIGRQSFVTIYTVIVTMISTMTALAGPALVFYWSIQQDQRTVLNLTYSFIKEWRESQLTNAIYRIDEYFNEHRHDYENAKYNLYKYSLANDHDLFLSIKVLLNYIECIAGVCQQDEKHVDINVIRQYLEPSFITYYNRLKPFIAFIRLSKIDRPNENVTAEVYSDFEKLIKAWIEKNNPYQLTTKAQYSNMKQVLDKHPHIVEYGIEAIKRAGMQPHLQSIRGGTDGSRLSFMGLPCPNIFAGEHAFHGRQEWVSVQDMQKAVLTILHLCEVWEENS